MLRIISKERGKNKEAIKVAPLSFGFPPLFGIFCVILSVLPFLKGILHIFFIFANFRKSYKVQQCYTKVIKKRLKRILKLSDDLFFNHHKIVKNNRGSS